MKPQLNSLDPDFTRICTKIIDTQYQDQQIILGK